ncbi:CPBP family intramembrane glutamic endopeptidase [Defluviitalea phaphyphila]|uniref:CPBP family intramembrane glutamic endopeptidase n=1 Tax=Defluviitalea phaphyphila TaxID=1473580 RepID=UPI000730459B|nr:type II CAAX endopeptidase family protein [Defluviitalea phaphyphila]
MNKVLKANIFVFILILLGSLGSICLSILSYFLFPWFSNLPYPLLLVINQILFLIIPSIIYFIITKESIKKTLRLNWPGFTTILLSVSISIFIQPFMMFLSSITGLFFNNDIAEVINKLNNYPTILMFLVIALTPAICEEITMRGIFLSGYDNIDIKKAILLNGLFFAMLHLNFQQFLYTFALGALFAYIVRLTNSIIPSMVAHFTINGSQFLMQKFITYISQNTNQNTANLIENVTFMDKLMGVVFIFVIALFITPIAIGLIYTLRNIYKNKNLVNNNITSLNMPSNEKVFNWPVWASIALYISFMTFILNLENITKFLKSLID